MLTLGELDSLCILEKGVQHSRCAYKCVGTGRNTVVMIAGCPMQ